MTSVSPSLRDNTLNLFSVEIAPSSQNKAGVVFTRDWVVDLMLDLAGYTCDRDLASMMAIEPACGPGAFLVRMAKRLIESAQRHGKHSDDLASSLLGFDIDPVITEAACDGLRQVLYSANIDYQTTEKLVRSWVRNHDYLKVYKELGSADFVVGNPPYVRLEDNPHSEYLRREFSTMRGRADLYVAFFEAGLSQLRDDGVCAFICADRWMLNDYGAELRRYITQNFGVEFVIEMHETNAFLSEVNAYPAITLIRKGVQKRAVVARLKKEPEVGAGIFLKEMREETEQFSPSPRRVEGLEAAQADTWFAGTEPWPCVSPARLQLLKRLERDFHPLENEVSATKVGIGVATGADSIFLTDDFELVEHSRLLPLARPSDIAKGIVEWSGTYLVNPWNGSGLIALEDYPQLSAYFLTHEVRLKQRSIAKRAGDRWFRTIDRVNHDLLKARKLYITDIGNRLSPVLDEGKTYPHHNLYWLTSNEWNLEELGALLMSDVAHFFIECYSVRMRGGYLRFQAQYLRRIRLPKPSDISWSRKQELRAAFQNRDVQKCNRLAHEIYGIDGIPVD